MNIPVGFFRVRQAGSKIHTEEPRTKKRLDNLRKNKPLTSTKTYLEAIVIKTMCIGAGLDKEINRIESPEPDPSLCGKCDL